jgi:hypothetical protein
MAHKKILNGWRLPSKKCSVKFNRERREVAKKAVEDYKRAVFLRTPSVWRQPAGHLRLCRENNR